MAAREWDGPAFEAYRPLLFSIAYRMLGSATEAEDVLQDAWLRVRQGPAGWSRLRSWSRSTARRACTERGSCARRRYALPSA
jgi:RNA polymerase sigma-70 factor (ECF subfamily)